MNRTKYINPEIITLIAARREFFWSTLCDIVCVELAYYVIL